MEKPVSFWTVYRYKSRPIITERKRSFFIWGINVLKFFYIVFVIAKESLAIIFIAFLFFFQVSFHDTCPFSLLYIILLSFGWTWQEPPSYQVKGLSRYGLTKFYLHSLPFKGWLPCDSSRPQDMNGIFLNLGKSNCLQTFNCTLFTKLPKSIRP